MYQAAIIEDEKHIQEYLRDSLARALRGEQIVTAFDLFSEGSGFLRMAKEHYHYDMVFMDIEMPGLNGIEISRQLKQIAPDALIVFISNREELVFDTFEVQPFRFIQKSHFEERLPSLARAIALYLKNLKSKDIRFSDSSGDFFSFAISEVIYIEAQNKKCLIATTTGRTLVHLRFLDLEKSFPPPQFMKIHRSYLVNCRFIFRIGKREVTLSTGEKLPLSRNRAEEVISAFLQYANF